MTFPPVPGVTLRPFRPGDEEACAGVFSRAWATALPGLPRAMGGADFLSETRREEVVVAEEQGGRLVGFVSVYRPEPFIHHLFVEPNRQGRGIGKALLAHGLALVGRAATLKCLRRNEAALAFYARCGWRAVEEGADAWGVWSRFEPPPAAAGDGPG